ncbi:taste receptor type 2 member 14-like [Ochotona curzoniae]|uniref:taste receptor type 2 member 14-like n=1 Tax=Ochotona curzoniae TaxID=130825 RepID=UPI001B34905F|nr:taste receptor type 2 member 14-like [Ochotona curzoniae]
MAAIVLTILTLILTVEFIVGNVDNAFIVLVNSIDWVKGRKISSVDKIITALAVSRIGLIWFTLIIRLASAFYLTWFFTEKVLRVIHIACTVTNHFSIWFATSLSIFYFLKIAKFSNSTFLYLKWRVEKVVSGTVLMSLVLLFLNIALLNMRISVYIQVYKGNVTMGLREFAQLFRIFLFTDTVFMIIPFTMSLTTFLLLIFSLWKHLRKMQLSAKGSRDASIKAHLQALQTVVAFLVLCTVFLLSSLLQTWGSALLENCLSMTVCHVFEMTYPSLHSFILILGNRKLRQAFLAFLRWLSHRFKDAPC